MSGKCAGEGHAVRQLAGLEKRMSSDRR
jgi:hypothetical protein